MIDAWRGREDGTGLGWDTLGRGRMDMQGRGLGIIKVPPRGHSSSTAASRTIIIIISGTTDQHYHRAYQLKVSEANKLSSFRSLFRCYAMYK
ncbi:hypothetical protein E2C01_000873 [Portunus trituberculatus]|uniref:Uncharacterized protein n=1 Tax=Portunus trituberculatus TaxID=210409 RepID=A0A5B7CL31_PORTR|nr:hypothetical protein [Portunus trituberculatus]